MTMEGAPPALAPEQRSRFARAGRKPLQRQHMRPMVESRKFYFQHGAAYLEADQPNPAEKLLARI